MKKFLILIILLTAGVTVWWFLDPSLKERVNPLWDELAGNPDNPVKTPTEKPAPSTPAPKPPAPKPAKSTEKTNVGTASKPAPKPEAPKSEIDLLVEKQYPMPPFQPLLVIVDNWNNVPPRAYPEKVITKDVISFTILLPNGSPAKSNLGAGNSVKPFRLAGDILHVTNLQDSKMKTQIHVDKTDFKEQIEQRYNAFTGNMEKRILAMRANAKKQLLAQPDQVASLKAGGTVYEDDGDPRFHPVKASLAAGEVTAFNLDEAVGFRWNGREKITSKKFNGSYDTVTVNYEANTIFGVFPGEMKCLIQSGRVVGWVDPYTMEERI